MEQTIIEFFSKASELILHNRIRSPSSAEYVFSKMTNPNAYKFQLCFDQKFKFSSKIPTQWNNHDNKLLVIEFFLVPKKKTEKYLVEQWIFELNQVEGNKLSFTIDSQNTLYKRLAILLRTVSSLTATLPLYKDFLNDKSSKLHESFTIDSSINFTRHSLSSWHYSVHEEKILGSYTNPDIIVPGKAFAFKVNYVKSFKFLIKVLDDLAGQEAKIFQGFGEKIDPNYFGRDKSEIVEKADKPSFVKNRQRLMSDGNIPLMNNAIYGRKSTSDFARDDTCSSSNTHNNPWGSFDNEDKESPIGSIFAASPIETQRSSKVNQPEKRHRKNSSVGMSIVENKVGSNSHGGNRPRFYTIDSEGSGDFDMYILENENDKFTEIVTGREIEVRDESPTRISIHPNGIEDDQPFSELSRKLEKNELKLSGNLKPIEKILEQTDDDKIAEILHVIDEIKELSTVGGKSMKGKYATSIQEIDSQESKPRKGFLFEATTTSERNIDKATIFSQLDDFKGLYLELTKV